jgi:hypothetical protein
MLHKIIRLIPFYSPDGDSGGGDFVTGALDDLGEFDTADDNKDDDLDDDKVKDDDIGEDIDEDADGKEDVVKKEPVSKEIRDTKIVEEEDDKEEDADKEDEKKAEEDKKKQEEQVIEAKDLTPRALKESYPKIFKEFPELKDVIFQNREYNKIYGSVEDAVEAKEKAQILDDISASTLQGDPTELLAALEKTERGRTEEFAANMLTEIRRNNSDMYYRVTDPIIASALKAAETHASKSGDKNLLLATKYLATFVFGDQNIPAFNGTKRKEQDPERIEFERQRAAEAETRYNEHQKTIYDYTEKKLDEMIREGLDPDNVYNNFVREALADKVMSRIGATLKADKAFQGQMSALWKKAHKNGFSREDKQRIAHTYLAKARRIMPAIRSKIRGEAKTDSAGNVKRDEKKIITSGGGGNSTGNGKKIPSDPKKIDWSKVSDEDILASS